MGKSYQPENQTHHSQVLAYINHQLQGPRNSARQSSWLTSDVLAVQWPLTDPLFQDLNPHSRYYLHHFATQICSDIVIYDGPGTNPMRDMIPATSTFPVLLQVILANSAFHVFNISRDPIDASSYQQERKTCLLAYYQAVTRFGGPLKSAYKDALVAKTQALSMLAQCVTNINNKNVDFILAAVLLFVNYDLIESESAQWKVHMEGASKLITLLAKPAFRPHEMSKLRTYLLSDLLV
jgi:hypothetical protein